MNETGWRIHEPVFEADEIIPDYRVWPWNGHRLFAYDLIAFLAPKVFVELGTYWGTSLFTFCQAIKDLHLPTRCVAVDTWEGDDHTGAYDRSVYETVCHIRKTLFAGIQIELVQSLFAEALAEIENESIELLHIDGFHTYEAVRSDFTSWLPKLASNGVVLFHDIADDCGYGSVRYWHELQKQYPHFSFQHSWGLGVLFPKGADHYQRMVDNNINDKIKIYEYAAEYALLKIQKAASDDRGERQDTLIKHQERQIVDLEKQLSTLQAQMAHVRNNRFFKIANRLGFKLS